ncbi:hypothetical protein PQX77_013682 [Marasmius sp. AFHP31]|nr:hypothetical protein PQX77_013682 [Marasmius sp. AFHP31]
MKTALIPGAVQAWIDAVVFAAEAPAPPTLDYEELQFFVFTPQMGRWLSPIPLAYCPLVCNLYYLERLQQNKAWHYTDSEVDVPSIIPCLILRIPLDRKREALLGLLLQHFFLSRHISIYWGFVACFDFRQAPIYFYEDNLSKYIPLESQNVIDIVAEAITRVGFLGSRTAFIPGATHTWINSVVHCMVDPPSSKLEPKQLIFFQYDPPVAHWVTCPSCHHNPILYEEFYLDELNQPNSPSVWDYQRDDSELDKYFGWDEVAVHNMWE